MSKYKLIIFDMDGTILYTLEDLWLSTNYILESNDYPSRTIEEVRLFVGNGIHKLIERAVPKGTDDETIDFLFQQFIAYYEIHCSDHTKPYDGIIQLLEHLKQDGYILAVVSNKADGAVNILSKQYFNDLFDVSIGERKGIQRKPSPDSVSAVMEQFGILKENTLYVGDSEVDILTANNAGVDHVSVNWGYRDESFLYASKARYIVSSAKQLEKFIKEMK